MYLGFVIGECRRKGSKGRWGWNRGSETDVKGVRLRAIYSETTSSRVRVRSEVFPLISRYFVKMHLILIDRNFGICYTSGWR